MSDHRPRRALFDFNIYPPDKTFFSGNTNSTVPAVQLALSPDGKAIVFAASGAGQRSMLYLRYLDDVVARVLPGTENAQDPFWSPDGRWIAFFRGGNINKLPAEGGRSK